MPVSVGIDLGTTFSAVAWVDPGTGQPAVIPTSEGKRLTPSVIQFRDDGPVFGTEASSAFAAGEPGCAATFKRSMGDPEPFCTIDGQSYTAEDLSAMLLRHLVEDAEAALGDTITDAVVTVPAYFYDLPREATLRAAERAGLRVKKLIDEPNAAAMAYGLGNWRENANLLVYDLGGGTFDVTVVRMGGDGALSTIATRGDHALGGRDWDGRIERLLREKFADETGLDLVGDVAVTAMLRGMVEAVKIRLSQASSASATATFAGYGPAEVCVTRAEFEELTSDLLERTGALCRAVLDEAGLAAQQVTDALLVGGSTRMPQVSAYLEGLLGKRPIRHVNPDEAVALGAAIQSTKAADTYAGLSVRTGEDGRIVTARASGLTSALSVLPAKRLGGVGLLTLRETTAHAMGVIALNSDQTRYINDTIIPANHPRPVRVAKAFTHRTRPEGNNEMEVFVLQGDKPDPLDNQIPYRYVVSGIRHIPDQRGRTLVRVQYSYDTNGIIHVEARQEQDNLNLPIRREPVPGDMSVFARPVTAQSPQVGSAPASDVIGVYSKWAGVSRIPTASVDRYGNAAGDEFDLVEDGAFDGQVVYVLNLCSEAWDIPGPRAALTRKGFQLVDENEVPPPAELSRRLRDASQFWLISDRMSHLDQEHIDVIESFFDAGHGVYIWGDNDPYYQDANSVLARLFGVAMWGDSPGDHVVSLKEPDGLGGVVPDHLISTGIVSIYEGVTIAEIQTSEDVLPLVYGSNGKVVTAYFDDGERRALIDGGFTRLYHKWNTAGTDRYIVNAAAWLVNLERFAPKKQGRDQASAGGAIGADRDVPTWDDGEA